MHAPGSGSLRQLVGRGVYVPPDQLAALDDEYVIGLVPLPCLGVTYGIENFVPCYCWDPAYMGRRVLNEHKVVPVLVESVIYPDLDSTVFAVPTYLGTWASSFYGCMEANLAPWDIIACTDDEAAQVQEMHRSYGEISAGLVVCEEHQEYDEDSDDYDTCSEVDSFISEVLVPHYQRPYWSFLSHKLANEVRGAAVRSATNWTQLSPLQGSRGIKSRAPWAADEEFLHLNPWRWNSGHAGMEY